MTRTKKIEKGFPTKVSAPITGKYWAEGPAPLFVGDTLYVYFDKYRDHRYGAVRSLDYGETWEDVSDQVFFPRGIRHGTAFAVDASIVESLIADRNYNPLIPDNLADPSVSNLVIPIIFMALPIWITDLDVPELLSYGNRKIL